MKALLQKEFRLALHPTVPLFWALSAMLMIPAYPYYVVFFYTALGLFFVCLTGRENHDIEYSAQLPIRKRDIVKARIWFAVIVEGIQLAACVPFILLRRLAGVEANVVGMEANAALLGFGLVLLGVYNLTFFTAYYRAPDKVGKAFMVSSVVMFLLLIVLEACAHALPFMRDRLDTFDPLFMGEKLATLAAGIAVYAGLTWTAYRIAAKRFEALDL